MKFLPDTRNQARRAPSPVQRRLGFGFVAAEHDAPGRCTGCSPACTPLRPHALTHPRTHPGLDAQEKTEGLESSPWLEVPSAVARSVGTRGGDCAVCLGWKSAPLGDWGGGGERGEKEEKKGVEEGREEERQIDR